MNSNFTYVDNFPGLVSVKDNHSNILNISDEYAKLLGWISPEDRIGKTDYDISCEAALSADEFIKNDKKVVTHRKKLLVLEIQNYSIGQKIILVEKNPLKDAEGNVMAVFNNGIDVTNTMPFRAYLALHHYDANLGGTFNNVIYTLSDSYSPLFLTEKQENCLFLLIRGKTIKEIAKILKIAPRTVECHIDAIKNKLNCQYKSEIIEKSINSGFLYYVPKYIQSIEINKIVSHRQK